MAAKYLQLMLTPAVQQAQDHYFGKHQAVKDAPETDALTPDEAEFIASRDSFYLATVSETGWPYLQHRGGPPGFVKVLGPNLIGFADFKGNRQLISTGNLDVADRVALFLMDYPRRTRLKLLGHARVLDAREHPELVDRLAPEPLRSKVERLFLIEVISYDWHCPQYITPRFTAAEVETYAAPLKARIAALEAQLAARTGSTANRVVAPRGLGDANAGTPFTEKHHDRQSSGSVDLKTGPDQPMPVQPCRDQVHRAFRNRQGDRSLGRSQRADACLRSRVSGDGQERE